MLIIDSKDCENIDKAPEEIQKEIREIEGASSVTRAPELYQALRTAPESGPEGGLPPEDCQRQN